MNQTTNSSNITQNGTFSNTTSQNETNLTNVLNLPSFMISEDFYNGGGFGLIIFCFFISTHIFHRRNINFKKKVLLQIYRTNNDKNPCKIKSQTRSFLKKWYTCLQQI